MKIKEFNVVIERDAEGYYVASVPALPACHTQAKSLDKLMERIREAVELYLEVATSRVRSHWRFSVGVHSFLTRSNITPTTLIAMTSVGGTAQAHGKEADCICHNHNEVETPMKICQVLASPLFLTIVFVFQQFQEEL